MGVTARGTVLVTGMYRNIAVFDAITLHSAGEEDIFLAQLNAGLDRDNDDCDGLGCREQDETDRINRPQVRASLAAIYNKLMGQTQGTSFRSRPRGEW